MTNYQSRIGQLTDVHVGLNIRAGGVEGKLESVDMPLTDNFATVVIDDQTLKLPLNALFDLLPQVSTEF